MKRILVMGLPGSGKTTFSDKLKEVLDEIGYTTLRLNADQVREAVNDWDFSPEGRLRQAHRMRHLSLCDSLIEKPDYVIVDFVAPTQKIRDIFDADCIVWMDTIEKGRFSDTNAVFEKPDDFDFRVPNLNMGENFSHLFEKDQLEIIDLFLDHVLKIK